MVLALNLMRKCFITPIISMPLLPQWEFIVGIIFTVAYKVFSWRRLMVIFLLQHHVKKLPALGSYPGVMRLPDQD